MRALHELLARSLTTVALSLAAGSVVAATAPCAIETRSVQVGGGTVPYNVAGSGSTVLVIHGLFAEKEQWSALACRLADAGYRAIAVDLPGYGKSSGFGLSVYRLERQVDLLAALAAKLGLDRFDLAGNSMGGAIASMYAARHPAQVRSLALLGSPLGVERWHPDLIGAIHRGINPFIPVDTTQLDIELGLLFVHPPTIPPADKQAIVDTYVRGNRHYVQVWNIVNLYDDILSRTRLPGASTLIVWGDGDRVYPVAGAERFARRLPHGTVKRLPGAGHLLHMESAEEVAPIYVGFLKDVATAPPGAGLANPASQNCAAKGGTPKIEKSGRGGEFGVCVFPDNLQCEEWAMLRGDCRTGGIKVTGFVTPAARYCAITGGAYTVTVAGNTPNERGTCTFKGGKACDAAAYFAGTCAR